jgi:hypothetical protein
MTTELQLFIDLVVVPTLVERVCEDPLPLTIAPELDEGAGSIEPGAIAVGKLLEAA